MAPRSGPVQRFLLFPLKPWAHPCGQPLTVGATPETGHTFCGYVLNDFAICGYALIVQRHLRLRPRQAAFVIGRQ